MAMAIYSTIPSKNLLILKALEFGGTKIYVFLHLVFYLFTYSRLTIWIFYVFKSRPHDLSMNCSFILVCFLAHFGILLPPLIHLPESTNHSLSSSETSHPEMYQTGINLSHKTDNEFFVGYSDVGYSFYIQQGCRRL